MSIINLEEFCTSWQRFLRLTNETRPHVIREQLLSRLLWIKEKRRIKEPNNRVVMWWILVASTHRRVAR